MQHNYYFLRHLSPMLHTALKGLELVSCFCQNKDELLIGFANQDKGFYIKALLTPILCTLSFPETVNRSRRNNVDLFQTAIGFVVKEVLQLENERAFVIAFEDTDKKLLFKMQGQRANIVLFEEGIVTEIFKSELENDWQLDLTKLNRIIDQTESGFMANGLQKTFPTFDKTILQYITQNTQQTIEKATFADIQKVLQVLENPTYYIVETDKKLQFTLLKPQNITLENSHLENLKQEKILFESQNPILALNQFQHIFNYIYYFETEKNEALKKIEAKTKQTQQYIKKVEEKLWELIGAISYEQVANIIMANLHDLPPEPPRTAKTVELFDFYNNTTILIKLKENLTPQKTAESYYRKSKNQKIEIDRLEQNIQQKKDLLIELQANIIEISNTKDFKVLRKYLEAKQLTNKPEETEHQLFKKFMHEGFEIWVGKNAKNNDLLTQRYAYKEDLWLHARDVAGSHVIIKYQAGKTFPSSVIERAAQLAAYFSKRKNDTLCPVICTPKKYVRKPKGAMAGMVKVEREDVIMVNPML